MSEGRFPGLAACPRRTGGSGTAASADEAFFSTRLPEHERGGETLRTRFEGRGGTAKGGSSEAFCGRCRACESDGQGFGGRECCVGEQCVFFEAIVTEKESALFRKDGSRQGSASPGALWETRAGARARRKGRQRPEKNWQGAEFPTATGRESASAAVEERGRCREGGREDLRRKVTGLLRRQRERQLPGASGNDVVFCMSAARAEPVGRAGRKSRILCKKRTGDATFSLLFPL